VEMGENLEKWVEVSMWTSFYLPNTF